MEQFLSGKVPIEFACQCGILNPLTKLFFCRHCLNLRCSFCCHHEVDSHFCSNCLENIPSTEAKLRKNKCNSCFDCPSCHSTLSTRAHSVQVPMTSTSDSGKDKEEKSANESTKMVSKKMYYLACLSCRWTSRDVGISDQPSQTFSWPEPEYPHATRFQMLLEHFQAVVLREKQERQEYLKRKAPRTTKFPSMTDRTGLTVSSIRRSMGFEKTSTPKPKAKPTEIQESPASAEVEKLPDDIFTEPVNLNNISTIKQRLCQPANQPQSVKLLYPQHKNLTIKRSLRCRHCEHNVIKPEYNPTSIKYRIQLCATSHVPDVRFVKVDPLKAGESSSLILKLSNPTINDMTITIMDLPTKDEEKLIIEETKKSFYEKNPASAIKSSLASSLNKQQLIEEPRYVKQKITGKIELPDSSFVIGPKDDSAEFDDDVQTNQQEPKFIIKRKSNKVFIKLNIVADKDLKSDEQVVAGFTLQFTYVSNQTASRMADESLSEASIREHALSVRTYIDAGKILQS